MARDSDTPMVGGDPNDELTGSDLDANEEPESYVGPHDPDDPLDAGETGAEARSEQRRKSDERG